MDDFTDWIKGISSVCVCEREREVPNKPATSLIKC